MARKSARTSLKLPTIARRRSSWAERTGACTKAAGIAAKALTENGPEFITDEDGHRIRVWKPEEMQSYSNADIVEALRLKRAVEGAEMLEFIPPSAVKYCVTKGWILKGHILGDWYWVTKKAAAELDLPRKVRGERIQFHSGKTA